LPRESVPAVDEISRGMLKGTGAPLAGRPGRERDELADLRAHPGRSIQLRYVVNLEDGRKYRMLTSRTLAKFGLTTREYRMKWGLPQGQPLLAKSLLATRRNTARELGLGEKLQEAQRHRTAAEPMPPGRPDDGTPKRTPRTRRRRRRSARSPRREPALTR
jgi:predicted transcriptional regulator